VACEFSGIVRDAFAARGHDAWSCDLLPSERPGQHIQDDVLLHLADEWDLMIAHPPCRYLALSGLHWNRRRPERRELHDAALHFVRQLLAAPIPRIALENPVGAISKHIRKPDWMGHPHHFGDPESKLTCLWLKNLPPLMDTAPLAPIAYQINGRPRWLNQTATGQNKLGPSPTRAAERGRTYPGFAEAMAEQWGSL
jgi:hypothetical protein